MYVRVSKHDVACISIKYTRSLGTRLFGEEKKGPVGIRLCIRVELVDDGIQYIINIMHAVYSRSELSACSVC